MDLSKRTWRAAIFDKSEYGYGETPDIPAEPYEANIVCSDVIEEVSEDNLFNDPPIISKKPKHMPVIDIDVKATLIPSTTPGHSHLYIDHEVEWDDYLNLLKVMAKCGIVEEGYVRASEVRGYSAVRLPWIRKVVEPEPTTAQDSDAGARDKHIVFPWEKEEPPTLFDDLLEM